MELPDKPKKRGTPPAQYESEMAAYNAAMRAHWQAHAKAQRERMIVLGVKSYEWLAAYPDGGPCGVAARNNGKVFSFAEPPPEGHVGEGECTSPGWCTCRAAPIVEFE